MGIKAITLSCFLFSAVAHAETVTFAALYNYEDASTGFNDPVYGAVRRTAFENVLAEFSTLFESTYAGETVYVTAEFVGTGGFVAQGGGTWNWWDRGGNSLPGTVYDFPLLNHLTNGATVADLAFTGDPQEPLIRVKFNDNMIDGLSQEAYFGGDHNVPAGDLDFSSLASHEVMHGLGFSSAAWWNNNLGDFENGWYPRIWDRFLADGTTGQLWTAMTGAEREAAAKSNNLVWIGANATAANGGINPNIYSDPWQGNIRWGSALIHFDEATFGNYAGGGELMTPYSGGPAGGGIISPMALGALQDMGWNLAPQPVPEPSTVVLVVFGAGVIAWRRRRRTQASKRAA